MAKGSIDIDGFEDFEELIQKMTVTEATQRKAMKKAIEPIAFEVEKNTPERTGTLKKSIIRTVKKDGLAVVGIVRMGKFYDIFQEFGTSHSKSHVGFFERSVNRTQDEAISILKKELLG